VTRRFHVTGIGPAQHRVVDDEASLAAAVALALDGPTLEIQVADDALAASLYDELRRVAPVRILDTPAPDGIDADQCRLLRLLADGATVREAAACSNMSLRTAYRRLAEARARLGVSTNLAAFQRIVDDPEIGSL
jgi:hypothetical protein